MNMSAYYRRYENKDGLCFYLDKDNSIISVENLSKDNVFIGNEVDEFKLKPGEKLSFSPNMKLYEDELSVLRKKQLQAYVDDELEVEEEPSDWGDCND